MVSRNNATESGVLVRRFGEVDVHARRADGYANATELCRAAGKKWNDYARLDRTKRVLASLATEAGIPVTALVQSSKGGDKGGGTWIHPLVMLNFVSWACSDFEAKMIVWANELLTTGRVELAGATPGGFVQVPAREWELQCGRIEHLERALTRIATSLEQAQAAPQLMIAPALPRFTVMGRVLHRGYGKLTREARRRIYRKAKDKIEEVSEDPLCQAGGTGGGGPLYFTGPHVAILDDAIDLVLEQIKEEGREKEKNSPQLTIKFEVA